MFKGSFSPANIPRLFWKISTLTTTTTMNIPLVSGAINEVRSLLRRAYNLSFDKWTQHREGSREQAKVKRETR